MYTPSKKILKIDQFRLSLIQYHCVAAFAMKLTAKLTMKLCVCMSVLMFKFFTVTKHGVFSKIAEFNACTPEEQMNSYLLMYFCKP